MCTILGVLEKLPDTVIYGLRADTVPPVDERGSSARPTDKEFLEFIGEVAH